MGKNKKRKRQHQQQHHKKQQKIQHAHESDEAVSAHTSTATCPTGDGVNHVDASEGGEVQLHGVCPEELLITVDTLQALSNYCSGTTPSSDGADASTATSQQQRLLQQQPRPDLLTILSQKRYKGLRTVLHPFVVALHTKYDPHAASSYQSRVTASLQAGRWADAYTALKGCLDLEVGETGTVKRGTVQRWVRLCDDCPHAQLKLKILRAVLACSPQDAPDAPDADIGNGGGTDNAKVEGLNKHDPRRVLLEHERGLKKMGEEDVESDDDGDGGADNGGDDDDKEMKIVRSTEWCAPSSEVAAADNDEENASLPSSLDLENISVETVHHVPPEQRKPPNHYELKIYATPPNTITMQQPTAKTKRHDIDLIPGAYGAFVLTNVLSASECKQIIEIAEKKMKYVPDHPTSSPTPTGIDTCEWLVDSSILDPIHERIMPHLNPVVHGEKVAGVNARWRLFRYGEERTYRPHIDGSWPGSGRDAKTGKYTSDAFNGDRRSRYTFLIYLNDGFEGGGTAFYLPAKGDGKKKDGGGTGGGVGIGGIGCKSDDGFETVVVKPSCGSVLCFPQGNTASLLHEGSRVTGGGVKYVVRTDLLYHLSKSAGS